MFETCIREIGIWKIGFEILTRNYFILKLRVFLKYKVGTCLIILSDMCDIYIVTYL